MAAGHAGPGPVDLQSCDREPIHIPGAIQPHGALLVLRSDDHLTVVQAAGDTPALLGRPVARLPGVPAAEILEAALVEELRSLSGRLAGLTRPANLVAHR